MTTIDHDTAIDAPARAKGRIIAGRALSGLAILFLVMDAGGKLIVPQMMIDNSPALDIPADVGLYRIIGGILAICTLLHAIPRSAVLGAVLLTGFLGGAIAVNLRAEMPLFSNTLFGAYLGVLVWAGLLLRDADIGRRLGIGLRG